MTTGYDDYLIMWYGAVLHLWVVQGGVIVEGVDLHPYLHTGDERCDETLRWVLDNLADDDNPRWRHVERVMQGSEDKLAKTLPLLTRVLELHDRIDADGDEEAEAELDGILEAAKNKQVPGPYGGMTVDLLRIDWDAVATVVPPLREPALATDWVSVRWADPDCGPTAATCTPTPTPRSQWPCTSGGTGQDYTTTSARRPRSKDERCRRPPNA